jgi:hypothetical protein
MHLIRINKICFVNVNVIFQMFQTVHHLLHERIQPLSFMNVLTINDRSQATL